jgi:hypothetical protein
MSVRMRMRMSVSIRAQFILAPMIEHLETFPSQISEVFRYRGHATHAFARLASEI